MNDEVKQYLEPGKKNLILIYVLYLSGILFNILAIVGAAFAYAQLNNENLIWRSHYIFAFRTFGIGLLGVIVSWISIIYIIFLVWFIVRSILGLQLVVQGLPHPNPTTLWIK